MPNYQTIVGLTQPTVAKTVAVVKARGGRQVEVVENPNVRDPAKRWIVTFILDGTKWAIGPGREWCVRTA